jgi:hypothetical protein
VSGREAGNGSGRTGDAYVLLEEARLRCEALTAQAATERDWSLLRRIHREIGMAGWLVSDKLDSDRRLSLLATAQRRSRVEVWEVNATQALAAAALLAEDSVADGLAEEDPPSDSMHLAHLYLLHAHDLLHGHLVSAGGRGGTESARL